MSSKESKPYIEIAAKTSPAEFEKVVRSRRSVRVYTAEKVPDEVVNHCLDMALLAPNSSNLQTWQFFWVKNLDLQKELIKACFSQPAAATANTFIVCIARPTAWKENCSRMLSHISKAGAPPSAIAYYKKLAPFVYSQGPLGIFGIIKRIIFFAMGFFRPVPRDPTSHRDMQEWSVKSSALACENLMLAFSSHGFDTCPMEGFDEVRVKKLLKLQWRDRVVMVVSAGKRAENGIFGPSIRFNRELFIKELV